MREFFKISFFLFFDSICSIRSIECHQRGGIKRSIYIYMQFAGLLLTKDRPDLSSGRAHKQDRTAAVKQLATIWSWAPDGARHQDTLTDGPSVVNWLGLGHKQQNEERSVVCVGKNDKLYLPSDHHCRSAVLSLTSFNCLYVLCILLTCYCIKLYSFKENYLYGAFQAWEKRGWAHCICS
jgi:hypothetical protein